MTNLPEGWALAPLQDVIELNPRKPPLDALTPGATVSFVPMAAVDEVSGTIAQAETRHLSLVRNGYTAFRDGDVILAKITPCFENGKAAIARGLENGLGFGSSEFHVLRPTETVAAEYVFHYVRQESFRQEAAGHMTGTAGQARVPAHYLKTLILPVPPLAEQGRIAAKVEYLLTQVSEARGHLARVQAIIDRFRQSVLAAACAGRLTEEWRVNNYSHSMRDVLQERRARLATSTTRTRRMSAAIGPDANALPSIPDTWAWAWLSELGELNRGKSRHRPRNDPRLLGGPYPFVQTGDIARSGGRVTSHGQTYSQAGLEQSRLWPAGTVCITIAANIAESAILTYAACFPDSVVGLIASSDVCVGEYAEYFVRTARRDLAQYAPATAQANINLEILREVAVPLPPVEEQREIARRVNDLLEKADAVEGSALTNDARAERLRQSILAKAFRGELVPTEAELAAREGRPYEPAAELLERVQKGVSPAPPRGRRQGRVEQTSGS